MLVVYVKVTMMTMLLILTLQMVVLSWKHLWKYLYGGNIQECAQSIQQ